MKPKLQKKNQLPVTCYKNHLQPKRASTMELFCEYTKRLTIFTIKAPSQMFDWVRPPKILKFSK